MGGGTYIGERKVEAQNEDIEKWGWRVGGTEKGVGTNRT